MRKMGIGLQLYTLRNELEENFSQTLREVAKLGYEGVEFAGYGGLSAPQMKELLAELGLQAIGSHVSLERLRDHLQDEIEYLKTIGGTYMICPYVQEEDRKTAEDWQRHISFLEKTGTEVRKQRLAFAYHNHDFEFALQIGGEFVFDALFALTSPDSVQVEMDVCWVQFAGQDPLAYMEKYAGRLPLLHVKDFRRDAEGQMVTLELGQGEIRVEEVISKASEVGVRWLIVEQDHCQSAPLESIADSMEWLRQNYLQRL